MANLSASSSSQQVFRCPLSQCSFLSSTPNEWLAHLRTTDHQQTFNVKCCYEDCLNSFKSFSALKSHVYRKHYGMLYGTRKRELEDPETTEESFDTDITFDMTDEIQADISRLLGTDIVKQKRESALFIMRLKEIHRLSQTSIDEIVSSCRSLFDLTVKRVHAGVRQTLAQAGSLTDVSEAFNDLKDPFTGLETKFLQEKYIAQEFHVVEPTTIKVGAPYYVDKFFGRKRCKVLHTDTFQYVSLLESLKMLLQNETFFEHLTFYANEFNSASYHDFCDGSFFKSHPVFLASSSNCLQLIAYYDELEVCNPLGSNVKKHKIGCVFFTLGNLHPKNRSNFKTIFLSTIVNYTVVVNHGMNAILRPFVEEVNKLSDTGITITKDGICKTYKVALTAFLADNLASHAVGGFKESMSFARRFCRSCLTSKEESFCHFTAEEFHLRTQQEHEIMCAEVAADTSKGNEKSKEYGINHRSILSDVRGFSVIGGLCHDIMHDLLEGVIPYELKLLLQHVFQEKYLTLSQYNERIKAFDYGYTEVVNKPNELPANVFAEGLKPRYSASEMLLVAHILPFVIGDKIPETDEYYLCFRKLLEILQIALSPSISDDAVSYLRVLIEEHHTMFTEIYPNESFIPKLHYLVHYPKQITEQGPLIRSWTMRYEGKLSYLKKVSRCGNFKNITLTLARRHQHWLSYHLHAGSMFTPDTTRGPIIYSVSISEVMSSNAISSSIQWITVNGLKYSCENCYLMTSVLLAYSFRQTSQLHIISVSNLPYPSVLHARKEPLRTELYLSPTCHVTSL